MISKKKLITANSVSADASSTTKLSDTSPTSHSPESRIAQAHNEIRIASKDFITQTIKLMLEFLPDVFGFLKDGVAEDGFAFGAAEIEEVIAWRVLLEDVSPVEFRMKVPYRCEGPWVLRSVILGEVRAVFGSEGDDSCVV